MKSWQPTQAQVQAWEEKGYFTVPGVATADQAAEMRGVIKNILYTPEPENVRTDADPMDPMGDTPEARAQRFRKFNRWCHTAPLVWHTVHAGAMAPLGRYYLGDDILLKFSSVFVKPAKSGAATPWHQDNGLWRDGETEPFNFWMALDPAKRENGCLQFIPGSHKTEIVEHVLYADSIHGELPRERVAALKAERGWLLVPGVLADDEIEAMREYALRVQQHPESLPEHERFFVAGPLEKLTDHPVVVGFLNEFLAFPGLSSAECYGFRMEGTGLRNPAATPERVGIFNLYNSVGSRWSSWSPPAELVEQMPPMRQTLFRGTYCADNVPGFRYGGQNQRDRPVA